MMRLRDYFQDRKAPEAEFVRRHPDPVLFHRPQDEESQPANFRTEFMGGKQKPSATTVLEASTGLTTQAMLVVIPIVKKPEGAFRNQIGVGRARNADIHLNLMGISKYHAYFTWREDGTFLLVDADSKNGTFVDTKRLKPKEPYELRDRAILSFSDNHFRFHTPSGFYAAIGELSEFL